MTGGTRATTHCRHSGNTDAPSSAQDSRPPAASQAGAAGQKAHASRRQQGHTGSADGSLLPGVNPPPSCSPGEAGGRWHDGSSGWQVKEHTRSLPHAPSLTTTTTAAAAAAATVVHVCVGVCRCMCVNVCISGGGVREGAGADRWWQCHAIITAAARQPHHLRGQGRRRLGLRQLLQGQAAAGRGTKGGWRAARSATRGISTGRKGSGCEGKARHTHRPAAHTSRREV